MLEKIEYSFPKNDENIELFKLFCKLFKEVQYVKIVENEIHLVSLPNLKPETVFKLTDNITEIQLNIGRKEYLDLLSKKFKYSKRLEEIKRLPMKEVANKLSGHILRVDHTGINFPTGLYRKKEFGELLEYISSISNVYDYPTGDPWPFLLPTTEIENQTEISNFECIREPRFELVYDDYADIVTLQIDVETDLSKAEVEKLFPKEQGVYFDKLENNFKAIYLDYSNNIEIRLDVRFKCTHNDFESGKWFVSEGKRRKNTE